MLIWIWMFGRECSPYSILPVSWPSGIFFSFVKLSLDLRSTVWHFQRSNWRWPGWWFSLGLCELIVIAFRWRDFLRKVSGGRQRRGVEAGRDRDMGVRRRIVSTLMIPTGSLRWRYLDMMVSRALNRLVKVSERGRDDDTVPAQLYEPIQ